MKVRPRRSSEGVVTELRQRCGGEGAAKGIGEGESGTRAQLRVEKVEVVGVRGG